jgi:plastocyanin/mono/diheme cytochrome c family protein
MNTQKQITVMVLLVFALLGGCAAYTVYDQNRENDAGAYQQEVHAERGARIFAQYCRQCHGNQGEGRIGPTLNRQDLRDPSTRAVTLQWVTDTLMCGRIGKIMPPWAIAEGGSLTNEQIHDVVTLITTNAGDGWRKAGEFSAENNKIAPVASIAEVNAAASITGGTGSKVCGQVAATPGPEISAANVTPKDQWTENTTDNAFDMPAIAVNAGTAATVTVNNKGQALHNWEIVDANGKIVNDAGGKPVMVALTDPAKSNSVTFTITTPGIYKFQCDVHPQEMIGQIAVVAAGGTAPPGAGSGTPNPTPQGGR